MLKRSADVKPIAMTRRSEDGSWLVTLNEVINELYDFSPLGGTLSGPVIMDLSGIRRITSFGVRDWMRMLAKRRLD